MKKAKLWLKKYWWIILAGVGAVMGFAIRGIFRTKPKPDTPTFSEKAKNEADRLDLEIKIEKATVRAKSDIQKAELNNIMKIEDEVQKRKRLATFLQGLS